MLKRNNGKHVIIHLAYLFNEQKKKKTRKTNAIRTDTHMAYGRHIMYFEHFFTNLNIKVKNDEAKGRKRTTREGIEFCMKQFIISFG